MTWTKPEMVEIKMDAEISSYQDDTYDPYRDGPLFVSRAGAGARDGAPAETDTEAVVPRV